MKTHLHKSVSDEVCSSGNVEVAGTRWRTSSGSVGFAFSIGAHTMRVEGIDAEANVRDLVGILGRLLNNPCALPEES